MTAIKSGDADVINAMWTYRGFLNLDQANKVFVILEDPPLILLVTLCCVLEQDTLSPLPSREEPDLTANVDLNVNHQTYKS